MKRVNTNTIAALVSVIIWIAIGTVIYHFLEQWTYIDSFYFSVTTLSTVGYGDIVPTTEASKLFTALYILTGVSVVLTSLGIIGSNYMSIRINNMIRAGMHMHLNDINPFGHEEKKKKHKQKNTTS